jgi:DNA phosphorothioation-dependent restriction protein DptF
MAVMTLRTALSVLAKSSPFSVSTVIQRCRDEFDLLKEQLFVEQEIERDFASLLSGLNAGEVIFLCGSSGDGKSEILTRYYEKFGSRFNFYLDATHSFSPRQSAIEALDELFDSREIGNKPLVLGINIGMLANYANEGALRHASVREAIESFLTQGECSVGDYKFLDFEKYPKFQFSKKGVSYSIFAKELMRNLTRPSDENLFHRYACMNEEAGKDLQLVANFKLLSLESVQEVIITQLFKARLIKDQFITTRALLDLLYHLLLGPGYLFDNLFVGEGNELVQRLADFDPARMHTKELDQFVLRYELALPDTELDAFIDELATKHILFHRQDIKGGMAASLIRLFSLIRDESLGNNYHKKYKNEFDETLLVAYADIWTLHKEYNGSTEMKLGLRKFYTNELIAAVQRYANRNAPELVMVKDEIFLGEFGTVKLVAPVELKGDYDAIQKNHETKSAQFLAYLKVFEISIQPVSISLNLFELIYKLNRGYRPNKYDKNAIVLLDEVVEQISEVAKSKSSLKFYEGRRTYLAKLDDGMISICGVV